MTLALFGGSFDPPHLGHVELARRAKQVLEIARLLVLVSADPGHKHVETPADIRLRLTRAAFPDDDVVLDPLPRTVDLLHAHPEWHDPVFLIGADQFLDFPTWTEPAEVLRLTRLAVATRPGFPAEKLETALAQLEHPDRVSFFEIEPLPFSSRELRARLGAGEDVSAELPPLVAALIRDEVLYSRVSGYTG